MSIDTPLFSGNLVRLGPIDHDKDPEVVSQWTHDAGFVRMMNLDPMSPMSAWRVKKKLDELEKAIEERNLYHFRIRARADDRLLGYAELYWISWSNGIGNIRLGIGAPDDRRKGYGRETLSLLLDYAFSELNLHRLAAVIPEYNLAAQRLFSSFGFMEEVRRRKALDRDCRFWDLVYYGLFASSWKERK